MDVLFDVLALPGHSPDVVAALALLDALEHVLVLLDDLDELPLPEGLVEGALEVLGYGGLGPLQQLIQVACVDGFVPSCEISLILLSSTLFSRMISVLRKSCSTYFLGRLYRKWNSRGLVWSTDDFRLFSFFS